MSTFKTMSIIWGVLSWCSSSRLASFCFGGVFVECKFAQKLKLIDSSAEDKEAKPSTGSIPAINRGHTAKCLTHSPFTHTHTHIFNSDTLQGGNINIPSQEIEIHQAHFVMNLPTSLFCNSTQQPGVD